MKRSELKSSIREEILEILSEVTPNDLETAKAYNAELEKAKELSKDLVGEVDDDDEMDKKAMSAAKKGDSISKLASKLQQTTKEMKQVVKKWKNAEGAEKEKLTNRLRELTKIKKELEGLL
jgi:gas vesicle protein